MTIHVHEIEKLANESLDYLCKEWNLGRHYGMRAAFEIFRNDIVFRAARRERQLMKRSPRK